MHVVYVQAKNCPSTVLYVEQERERAHRLLRVAGKWRVRRGYLDRQRSRQAIRFVVKGDAGFGKRTLFIRQVVLYVEGLGFMGSFSGCFGVLLGR